MKQSFFDQAQRWSAATSAAMASVFTVAIAVINCGTISAQECPLSLTDIEQVFGKGFKAETTSDYGGIQSCRFSTKDYTVHISVNSAYGMTCEAYNKMMSPKSVAWKPISGDPDQAAIEVRDDNNDDLASTPAVTYVRGDKYVRLQVLGLYYGFSKSDMPAAREEMRAKLARLRRIP